MAVDKKISVEPKDVGIGQLVEVVPFKPRPDSPFGKPGGYLQDKPEVEPEDDKKITSMPTKEAERNLLSIEIFGKPIKELTPSELNELDEFIGSTASTKDDFEFYYQVLSGGPTGYSLKYLKTLTLNELDELLQESLRSPMAFGGIISNYKKHLRKP